MLATCAEIERPPSTGCLGSFGNSSEVTLIFGTHLYPEALDVPG